VVSCFTGRMWNATSNAYPCAQRGHPVAMPSSCAPLECFNLHHPCHHAASWEDAAAVATPRFSGTLTSRQQVPTPPSAPSPGPRTPESLPRVLWCCALGCSLKSETQWPSPRATHGLTPQAPSPLGKATPFPVQPNDDMLACPAATGGAYPGLSGLGCRDPLDSL
jgi:hypothetical protein